MRKQIIVSILLLFYLGAAAQHKTYYISTAGNDANSGLSITEAWQTLSAINSLALQPGDQILLEGGQSFTGTILLDENDLGTAANPIIISSYGSGKASVYAINNAAIYANNAGGLLLSNLILKGDGSDHDGIDVLINQTTADIDHIDIDSIEVSGFGGRGFLMGAYSTDKGFNHINIEHSSFHDNGIAGLEIFGAWPAFSNTDFHIAYCKFYNNSGKITSTQNTGNGIVVSGVDGGVIEYCEAYNNGANNRSPGGGPVGIWVYDTKNVVIQYCESHHNKAGLLKDGGGFDIDGGSQYCTVQYCYSHDNEGYGMALVEYGSSNEFTGNIVRYNVSQNDARKNSYGAITIYAVDATHPVKNSEIYNNTVYVDANNLINGRPCAVSIQSQNLSGVSIRNNIFYATDGVDMINSFYALSSSEVYFQNNNYFSTVAVYDFWWNGAHYTSLDSWKNAATGQEMEAGISLGIIQNPLLEEAGNGGTVSPADGGKFTSLWGYSINPFSPVIDKAEKIGDIGTHDFFGNALPSSSNYDIGAAEAVTVYALPLTILNFAGVEKSSNVLLQWKVTSEEYLQKYEIQKSINSIDFNTICILPATSAAGYTFTDSNFKSPDAYYRLKYIYPNGRSGISTIIKIAKANVKKTHVFYNEGRGAQIQLYSKEEKKATISTYSANGSLIYISSRNLWEGYNSIIIEDATKWRHGVYFIKITTDDTVVLELMK